MTNFPGFEDVIAFNKANVEAFVEANKVLAAGLQEIAKEVVALSQAGLETATTAARETFKAKSVKEAIEFQVDGAKAGYEKLVADTAKLNAMGLKVTNEALAPVTARVNQAVAKFTKAAA